MVHRAYEHGSSSITIFQQYCTVSVIKCPLLGNITKGAVIITGVSYGSRAVTVCEDGAAVISGDVVRSCDLNAEWSGATGIDPVCEGNNSV
jgi:hypothetical protein